MYANEFTPSCPRADARWSALWERLKDRPGLLRDGRPCWIGDGSAAGRFASLQSLARRAVDAGYGLTRKQRDDAVAEYRHDAATLRSLACKYRSEAAAHAAKRPEVEVCMLESLPVYRAASKHPAWLRNAAESVSGSLYGLFSTRDTTLTAMTLNAALRRDDIDRWQVANWMNNPAE